ncbi:hypothetical protein L916_04766 [Phytophthora nicotianae]|uniref:No apical meristem-associated C-terminal domain-containing protein n=3 Tax=Phytophthora nicotianae TaxID=4792 RepID=V9FJV3_PHYNI|nr:hypothetical protein F443_04952 [Phytophthora nicotianae P1569]ETL45061.1 hypothetical protein L916_04766 [Phytophthora nicotianae]ETO80529.1 hypothetical protein F444_04998 [Phytophthora nicotianae P1976]
MRRGKERWTHADDKRLGRALLAVFASHGDVVLSDNCALWKRVQQRYQGLVTAEQAIVPDITAAPRSARSLHTRWSRGIRPDMVLFTSLVDKMQKTGKRPPKAIKQAEKLFREERSETNAAAVRQFVQGRQRPPTPTGDSETDSARPKLKFESFHFRHCYDILRSNPQFIQALLEQVRDHEEGGPRKRRRTEGANGPDEEEYSSSTSSDDSDTADSHEDEQREMMLQAPPANGFQTAKVGAISSSQIANGVKRSVPEARTLVRPPNVAQRGSDSVVITFDDTSDDLDVPRVECDREMANEYVRLRTQTLLEDRRLKLLAELRGVIATISQLAQQLAWNGVASAALAARTGAACPALNEDVLRDIAFFRGEKQRLKQAIAALDGGSIVTNGSDGN